MKNHVSTNTGLSEQEEDNCVSIFRGIMRVRHVLHEMASDVARTSGIHAAELNVVDILGKFGPISMGQLSRQTFISPSNTTNTVKKLESANLVRRRRSDKSDREVTVALTARGRAIFRKCYPQILADVDASLEQRLSRSERRTLSHILEKLAAGDGH